MAKEGLLAWGACGKEGFVVAKLRATVWGVCVVYYCYLWS